MPSDTPLPANVCTASCEAPTPDGIHLCRTHEDWLADELTKVWPTVHDSGRPISGLAEDLEVTRTRQDRITRNAGSRSSERPLAWKDRAATAATELNAILNAWAYEVAHRHTRPGDQLDSIHASDTERLAQWLWRNLDTAARLDQAGTLYAEVTDAILEAQRAVDQPSDPSPFGRCEALLPDDTECQEFLYGYPNRPNVSCKCGATHSVRARLEWMQDRCDNLVGGPTQLCSWLLVFRIQTTPGAVRALAARGRIKPAIGYENANPPVYKLTDTIRAFTSGKSKRGWRAA